MGIKQEQNYIVVSATRIKKLRRLTAEAMASVGNQFLWMDKDPKTFMQTIATIITLGIIDTRTNIIYYKNK